MSLKSSLKLYLRVLESFESVEGSRIRLVITYSGISWLKGESSIDGLRLGVYLGLEIERLLIREIIPKLSETKKTPLFRLLEEKMRIAGKMRSSREDYDLTVGTLAVLRCFFWTLGVVLETLHPIYPVNGVY